MDAIIERMGNTPMKLVIKANRLMKFRMHLAHCLILLAYWIGGMRFEKPTAIPRAERRQRARELAQGSKYGRSY